MIIFKSKYKTITILSCILLSCFSRCSCGSLINSDWESYEPHPNAASYAIGLTDSTDYNLYLDAIAMDALDDDFSSFDWVNVNDYTTEIHIMDENEETLLACVGYYNRGVLSFIYQTHTYADLNAQFYAENGIDLSDYERLTLRFVDKGIFQYRCPYGYSDENKNTYDSTIDTDSILSTVTINYAELFDPIEFEGYGTIYLRQADNDAKEYIVPADTTDGVLALNQLKLTDETWEDNETSLPETALLLMKADANETVACIDLSDYQMGFMGGFLQAELSLPFVDNNNQYITLDDLDDSENYVLVFAEQDEERCPSSLTDENTDTLGTSNSFTAAELTGNPINFKNDFGYASLFLIESE